MALEHLQGYRLSLPSLGSLCQCLATLTVRKAIFPGSPLVLSLSITEKSLSVSHSFLPGVYIHGSDPKSLLFFWLSSPGSLSPSLQTDPATSAAQRHSSLAY